MLQDPPAHAWPTPQTSGESGLTPWRQALENSGEGVWDWHLASGVQTFSRRWKEMLGYADEEVGTGYVEFTSRVHPEDLARVQACDRAHLDDPTQSNAIELRMRCKDGSWKWILSRLLMVSRDSRGQAVHVTGTHTDISERKRREAELHELNRQLLEKTECLETTLGSIGQGILLFDAASRLTTFNARVCELIDVPASFLSAHPTVQELTQFQLERGDFGPEASLTQAHARPRLLQLASGGRDELPSHYQRVTRAGRTLDVKTQVLPAGGLVRTVTDVSDYVKAEAARRQLNDLLDATQSIARVGASYIDMASQKVFWTEGVFRIFELSSKDYQPTLATLERFFTPAALKAVNAFRLDRIHQPTHYDLELQLVTAQGRPIWVHTMGTLLWENARSVKHTVVLQDITERKRAEAALRESEERWKLALESTGDGMWDWHVQSGTEFLSHQLKAMYGFTDDELPDRDDALDGRTHPDDQAQMARDRQAHFEGRTASYTNEHRILCKDGRWKWVLTRGMVISRDAQGRPLRMIGTHTDITQRKEAEALVWQQAHFDPLTGLPNRRMLRDRLAQEIKKTRRDHRQLAILFIDLDHFKEVNDTLGHDAGDQLLIQASHRIQACVREADTVARMGGDEFTVLLTELADAQSAERTLQLILQALAEVFQLGQDQVYVSASIGITLCPLDGDEVEVLFKNADQALYVAKGAGRNRFSFFTPALQEAAQSRVRLVNDLRVGLREQQFKVFYQPIVLLASGEIRKAEALIRWQHPARGLVSPAEFIPIAETSGLIVEIGDWVLQQALGQVRHWRARLHPGFQISVNQSPVQFHSAANPGQRWSRQPAALGLPGDCLVVEITEGLLLDRSDQVLDQLLELRDAGIGVSLDDFGTGYSALSYLQKFDIDFIKIDQSFVRHLTAASTDLALCKAIIVMAHELGIQVIAEGVETELQRDLLAAAGCDYAQGYLFARPMASADFEAFMASRLPVLVVRS